MKRIFSIPDKSQGTSTVHFTWQRHSGNYLAIAGATSTVSVYDRHGESVDDVKLPGTCVCMSWDKDGDLLAILNNKTNAVTLWDSNTRRTSVLDSSMGVKSGTILDSQTSQQRQDLLTFATWSKSSSLLAVGNSKGNLLIYNHQTAKKVPIIGKHTRKITCGAFNDKDLLALGSEDQQITVSNVEGDTEYSFACTAEPSDIQFSEMKENERANSGETTISAIVGKKNLMLINLNDAQNPINLQFQARYGSIMQYCWYGDGYILLGFEHGFLVSISTHVSEIGQEIFSVQDHKSYLSGIACSMSFGKAITVGDSSIKCRELAQLNEVYAIVNVDNEDKGLDKVNIADDGQLLAISGVSGTVHVFLTKLPVLGDAYRTRVACLSSLTEVTVTDEVEKDKPISFKVEMEPNIIGVGPMHVAVCISTRAWFYLLTSDGAECVKEREYMGTVQSIKLNNDFACALFEGKIHLHHIDSASDEGQSKLFPDNDKSSVKITSMALSNDFLIFSTDGGHLQYFYLEDWKNVNEYRHVVGIKSIHPEPSGTRLILVDEKMDAFIYNPINDSLVEVPDCHGNVKGVLWDSYAPDRDIFVTYDNAAFHTYIYYRDTIEGPKLLSVGATKLQHGFTPLILYNGQVTCLNQSGRTSTVGLTTHKQEDALMGKSPGELENILKQFLILKKWHNAWTVCDSLNNKKIWQTLGTAALEHMDTEFALRVYRHIGDVGMVWSLDEIRHCEDRNLLAGHLAMFIGKFDLAEKLYLDSTAPINALDMRRDLLNWDKALQLANRLAPSELPFISKEYAQQLEFMGDYANALVHYEKGIVESAEMNVHNEFCQGGIARCALRLGEIRRGIKIALESNNRNLKKECATILENLKQLNEAAQLYENGSFFDKAAAVYIKAKNWSKVGELLSKVHSPRIHSQYAKAMEAEKKYKLAAEAYKTAKDYDNVVRILLDHLNSPEEAVRIVRESKSIEGAKLVAKFFLKLNDHSSAIQFLVLSQCHTEAFKLAEQHDKMEIYASVIGDESNPEDYAAVAVYFEKQRKAFLAGKFYLMSGQHAKALGHLLSNGEDNDSIKLAVECVGAANDDELTQKLMNFLLGETDGIPKDAKHLFRLYLGLKKYPEAAKTAIIIAREEQNKGQYRLAHDVLHGMYQELKSQGIAIPSEMQNNLMLIHSYLLVKSLIKRGDDKQAARMLIRVAGNISKFPEHMVQILTSAVIQCSKSGLKNSAFTYAAMLMRPEHRKKIDEKYRKKIEAIVRKPEKGEEAESISPCPYCQKALNDSDLICGNCKSTVPYCIVTGKHMVVDDFSLCPNCRFPASFSVFRRVLDSGEPCLMCGIRIKSSDVERIHDPSKYLQNIDEEENTKEETSKEE